ncbi:hypothetical protein ACFHYQ_25725 [Sphaerimonospora cavernae]|uniref:Uncharacterized protein n=1 Tax=Sphaerimonospora cavernae TaxID=1740611 RepID=A0ABV6UBX3_9ACTN
MLVELTMRRAAGETPTDSPVDGVRIMALLPRRWHKDLLRARGEIIIRVHSDEETSEADIRARVTEILNSPEVSGWRLATCHTLVADPREKGKTS